MFCKASSLFIQPVTIVTRCQSRAAMRLFSPLSRTSFMTRNMSTEVESSAKITKIVDEIATLNLLETASLVSALKIKLNIQDVVMSAPAAAAPAASSAAPVEEKPKEKTSFKVTLQKFDPASKAKVIKEIKAILPGANLVEAKKFVESAPKTIKEDVPKDEAEKIKAVLETNGATVTLE